MTLDELSRLYYIREETESLKNRLWELRQAAKTISTAKMTGMPRSHSFGASRTEHYAIAIADVEAAIAEKEHSAIVEEIKLWRYVATIPNSKIRIIFALRFVYCLDWNEIGRQLDVDPAEAKMALYRHLKLTPIDPTNDPKA